jgi:hypothetical protein
LQINAHAAEFPDRPLHDRTFRVTRCGRICRGSRKINLSTVFGGRSVGIREVADKIRLVSSMNYVPGFFDEAEDSVKPGVRTRSLK